MRKIGIGIVCGLWLHGAWAAAPLDVTTEEVAQAQIQSLRAEVSQAKATVAYAEEELDSARQALMDIRNQRPVVVANNEPALEGQIQTYEIALEARQEAVAKAQSNLDEAKKDLQAAEAAYQKVKKQAKVKPAS